MSTNTSLDFAIETPRLCLRRFTPDDIEFLTCLLSDPDTMSHWPAPLDPSEAANWLQRALQSYAAHGFGRWLVWHEACAQPIGDVGIQKLSISRLNNDRLKTDRCENDLGYIIQRDHWGHGFGFEAASACVEWARGYGLDSVVAAMAEDNLSSIRVAEKLHMNLDYVFSNPRNRDKTTRLYRVLRKHRSVTLRRFWARQSSHAHNSVCMSLRKSRRARSASVGPPALADFLRCGIVALG